MKGDYDAFFDPVDITEYLSEETFDEISSGERQFSIKNVACYWGKGQNAKDGEPSLYTIQFQAYCQGQCITAFAALPGEAPADADLVTIAIFKAEIPHMRSEVRSLEKTRTSARILPLVLLQ